MICVNEVKYRGIFYVGGSIVETCRMFSSDNDIGALRKMAKKIGVTSEWYRDNLETPYYILDKDRQILAIRNGAVFLGDVNEESPFHRPVA